MSWTIEEFASREEWLAGRSGIGGSMAGAALGLSRRESPLSLFLRLRGQLDPIEQSEAMEWGHRLEPVVMEAIRDAVAEPEGIVDWEPTGDRHVIRRSVDRPWQFATVDGLCRGRRGKGIVEAKTTNQYLAGDWADGVPVWYRAQVDHYMSVLGPEYTFAIVGCLIGGQRFVWHVVERDEERIADLNEVEADLWRAVEAGDPSGLCDGHPATTRALDEAHPASACSGGAIDLSAEEEIRAALTVLRSAEEILRSATVRKTEAVNALKQRLGEAVEGSHGDDVIRWAPASTKRLDTKRLRAERPEIFEEFATTTTARRFRVNWGK